MTEFLPDGERTALRAKADRSLSLANEWRKSGFPPDVAAIELARGILAVLDENDHFRRENARLDSLTRQVNTCAHTDPATWPDDTEADQYIAEAESFNEAIWEIGEKYGVPLTNNFNPRWQDGVFVRCASEFSRDMHDAAEKHLVAPLRAELETARAAYALTINAMEGEITENNGVIRALGHRRDSGET